MLSGTRFVYVVTRGFHDGIYFGLIAMISK